MKTYCTNCHQPIEFDDDMAGLGVNCPDCGAAVKLPGFASSPLEPAKKTTRPVPPKVMRYSYKMIQIPQAIIVKEKEHKGQEAAAYLQRVVDEWAQKGWEFYRVDTIGVQL